MMETKRSFSFHSKVGMEEILFHLQNTYYIMERKDLYLHVISTNMSLIEKKVIWALCMYVCDFLLMSKNWSVPKPNKK